MNADDPGEAAEVDGIAGAAGVHEPGALTYGRYLCLDELLSSQRPRTTVHDELLFVIVHQVYELWFKQVIHEVALLQERLEAGEGAAALHTARRIAKILKTIVGQLDVLETMSPRQFASFRPELGTASGFQSYQFRWIEAMLGRRDFLRPTGDPTLDGIVGRRCVFDSLLRYLRASGWRLPREVLDRDPAEPWAGEETVRQVLAEIYASDSGTPVEVCEALVDIDEGMQEWRYRHVQMVQRIIGDHAGTGGSAGVAYLRSTLFRPAFPELWRVRSRP